MPITTVDNPKRYAGNGSTTTFATPPYLDTSDLVVYLRKADDSIVEWVEGTQFTLSGAGGTGDGVLTVATSPTDYTPADEEYLFIWLAVEATQDSSFSNVTASIRNPLIRELDRQALMIQGLEAKLAQCLRVPLTDLATISGTMELPLDSVRASKLLGFDSVGAPSVTAPGDLGNITAGDTLPIDEATAVVFKTGDVTKTLRFILTALTAAHTITMPNADVDLGKLVSLATLFLTADVGKILQVSAAGTGVTTAWNGGHPRPGYSAATDAALTVDNTATKACIVLPSSTSLTADRTVTLSATDAFEGLWYDFTRKGGGAYDWIISGLSGTETRVLLQDQGCRVAYLNSSWEVVDLTFRTLARDFNGAVINSFKLKSYLDDPQTITSSSGTLTIPFDSASRLNYLPTEDAAAVEWSGLPTAGEATVLLRFTKDSGAAYSIATDGWPTGTLWLSDLAPDLSGLTAGQVANIKLVAQAGEEDGSSNPVVRGSWELSYPAPAA